MHRFPRTWWGVLITVVVVATLLEERFLGTCATEGWDGGAVWCVCEGGGTKRYVVFGGGLLRIWNTVGHAMSLVPWNFGLDIAYGCARCCSPAVLEFLRSTGVGRTVPREGGENEEDQDGASESSGAED